MTLLHLPHTPRICMKYCISLKMSRAPISVNVLVLNDPASRCAADEAAGFSNYGAMVDVYAPGNQVRSAWRTSDTEFK